MLVAENLNFERNSRTILANISLTLNEGEMLQIQGENGTGKTTLLKILAGLLSATSGDIFWKNNPITPGREIYHANIAYVGHNLGIKSGLNVIENLKMALNLRGIKSADNIEFALTQLNLTDYQNTLVQYLSAGQQRRVALAKLLLLSSKLWILDEPFTAIDQTGMVTIGDIFVNHVEKGGMIIFTSHQAITIKQSTISRLTLNNVIAS